MKILIVWPRTVLIKKKIKNFNTTFSSDFINNNYFCRNVSRKVVNSRHTKKKIIEKRNKNKKDNNT